FYATGIAADTPFPVALAKRCMISRACHCIRARLSGKIMPMQRILIALDSVGIDPLGHNRPDSVYSTSRFLFPKGATGRVLALQDSPQPGILIETDVTDGAEQGAIECAITNTSIFSGQSASREHG